MSQHEPDDFTQLRGAFDQPIAPSPAFARRLKEEIGMEAARIAPTSPEAPGSHPGAAHGTPTGRVLRMNTWPGALMTAATIALVLALGFAALRPVIERNGDSDDPTVGTQHLKELESSKSAASATPVAATGAPSAWGGADRSFQIEEPLSRVGNQYQIVASGTGRYTFNAQIVGDHLVRVTLQADGTGIPALEVIDLRTGSFVWHADGSFAPVTASDGTRVFAWVHHSGRADELVAYDLESGETVWSSTAPHIVTPRPLSLGLVYADGRVYATLGENHLYAFDAASGEIVWEHEQPLIADRNAFPADIQDYPQNVMIALSGNTIYAIWEGRVVTALDAATGIQKWSYEIPEMSPARPGYGIIATNGTQVYVSSAEVPDASSPQNTSGYLLALDAASGERAWIGKDIYAVTMAVRDGTLYALSGQYQLVALDASTGVLRNDSFSVPAHIGASFIVASEASVWLQSAGHIYRFDASNLSQTPIEIPTGVAVDYEHPAYSLTVPMVWDGRLLIAALDGSVWQLRQGQLCGEMIEGRPPADIATTPEPPVERFVCDAPAAATPEGTPVVSIGTPTYESVELPVPGGSPEVMATFEAPPPVVSGGNNVIDPTVTPDDIPIGEVPTQPAVTATPVAYGSTPVGTLTPFDAIAIPGGVGPTVLRQGNTILQWEMANNDLVARDATTNDVLWTTDGQAIGRILSDGERVYAFMTNVDLERTGVFAYDLATGEERWFLPDPTLDTYLPRADYLAYEDGSLYFFDGGSPSVSAIDPATGTTRWVRPLDPGFGQYLDATGSQITIPLVIMEGDAGHLVLMSGGRYVAALSTDSGHIVWQRALVTEATPPSFPGALMVHDGVAYITFTKVVSDATPTADGQGWLAETTTTAVAIPTGVDLWESAAGTPEWPLAVDGANIVAFSPGSVISIGSADGSVRYTSFDAVRSSEGSEFPTTTINGYAHGSVWFAAESGSGMHVARVTDGKAVEYWFLPVEDLMNAGGSHGPVQLIEWENGVIILFEIGTPWYVEPGSGIVPASTEPVALSQPDAPIQGPATPTVEPTPTMVEGGDNLSTGSSPIGPTPTVELGGDIRLPTEVPSPTATVDTVIRPEATEG